MKHAIKRIFLPKRLYDEKFTEIDPDDNRNVSQFYEEPLNAKTVLKCYITSLDIREYQSCWLPTTQCTSQWLKPENLVIKM